MRVTRAELDSYQQPVTTGRHYVPPYGELADHVCGLLGGRDDGACSTYYWISRDGSRFAAAHVWPTLAAVVRSGHDRRVGLAVSLGYGASLDVPSAGPVLVLPSPPVSQRRHTQAVWGGIEADLRYGMDHLQLGPVRRAVATMAEVFVPETLGHGVLQTLRQDGTLGPAQHGRAGSTWAASGDRSIWGLYAAACAGVVSAFPADAVEAPQALWQAFSALFPGAVLGRDGHFALEDARGGQDRATGPSLPAVEDYYEGLAVRVRPAVDGDR